MHDFLSGLQSHIRVLPRVVRRKTSEKRLKNNNELFQKNLNALPFLFFQHTTGTYSSPLSTTFIEKSMCFYKLMPVCFQGVLFILGYCGTWILELQLSKDTVASMNNLANVFAKLSRFPEAAALHHRAWTLRGQTLGLEHPDAQMSQRNLAVVLKILGKDGEAAEILSASTENWENYNWKCWVERWYRLGVMMSLDLWVGFIFDLDCWGKTGWKHGGKNEVFRCVQRV